MKFLWCVAILWIDSFVSAKIDGYDGPVLVCLGPGEVTAEIRCPINCIQQMGAYSLRCGQVYGCDETRICPPGFKPRWSQSIRRNHLSQERVEDLTVVRYAR